MAITRSSIIKGPALITYNGATFFSKDDINVKFGLETFNIDVDAYGKVDERVNARLAEISFTPAGEWEALSVLFPYGGQVIGTSIFSGLPLVIKPIATTPTTGSQFTFFDVALTKMPDITLSAVKTLIGQVTFTAVLKDNTDWSAGLADGSDSNGSLFGIAAGSTSVGEVAAFDVTKVYTQPYVMAWGSTPPWDNIHSVDGISLSFDQQFTPIVVDTEGLADMMLSSLSVTVKAKVLGVTEGQLIAKMKMQGTSAGRGRSLSANSGGDDITAVNVGTASVGVRVSGAALKEAPLIYSSKNLRFNECTWVATRELSGSSGIKPLFSVGTTLPAELS